MVSVGSTFFYGYNGDNKRVLVYNNSSYVSGRDAESIWADRAAVVVVHLAE